MLRRVFLVLATLWIVAIPLAAFAASRTSAPSAAYGFALAIYKVGHLVCHQRPERSFHLWMASLPVCARCTGIYAGAAAMAVMLASGSSRRSGRAAKAEPRVVFLIAFLPTAATLIFEWSTGVMPANWIRALAGLPLGAAVAWAIGMVN